MTTGPVRRALAAVLALAGAVSACGQAGGTAGPDPEFVSGFRAEPVAVVRTAAGPAPRIRAEDVEPDRTSIAPGLMVAADDTGAIPSIVAVDADWAAFDAVLEHRFAGVQAFSVAVMVDGTIVHQAAFGERRPGGPPVAVTDRFRVASVSKLITSITVLGLVEDGVIGLDDPVGDLLAEYVGVDDPDPDAAGLTLRDLLSHTSGIGGFDGQFFYGGAASCRDAAATALHSVGTSQAHDYSNMNFCLVGMVVEAVTGRTYEQVVRERVLEPLGLDAMRIASTYDVGPDEVSHEPAPGRNYMEVLSAAGGWNGTPTDLVTLLNAIDPTTPGWKILSADTAAAMRYRVPSEGPPVGYGLGVRNFGDGYGHTGTLENARALAMIQDDGVTWAITVAANTPDRSGDLRPIVQQALDAAFS